MLWENVSNHYPTLLVLKKKKAAVVPENVFKPSVAQTAAKLTGTFYLHEQGGLSYELELSFQRSEIMQECCYVVRKSEMLKPHVLRARIGN